MTSEVPDAGPSPNDHAIAAKRFLRRIERLSNDLLVTGKLWRGADLWDFQIGLFDLQAEIQQGIARIKRLPRKDPARREALSDLSDIRWHARRLGDAFAWIAFGMDRRALQALAGNTRVPVSPQRGHADVAMMTIANQLASMGWGFPLLHDVTDCLRIGDVTFIKIDPETRSRTLTTVEMKTSLISKRPAGDNQVVYNYEVTAITGLTVDQVTELGVPYTTVDEAADPGDEQPVQRERRPDRRIEGQLRRLERAVDRQAAPWNEIVDIPGEGPYLASLLDSVAKCYWPVLRRIIRKARKEGCASESVESALMYVALYSEDGITEEHVGNARLSQDLRTFGVLSKIGRTRNSLVVNGIPVEEMQAALDFLPFYLYPIPKRALSDLIYGRLVILVLLNASRIVEALEADGFQVVDRTGRGNLSDDSFVVTARQSDSAGKSYTLELHGLASHMNVVIYEFRSIHYMVEVARQMRDVSQARLIDQVRRQRDVVAGGLSSAHAPDRKGLNASWVPGHRQTFVDYLSAAARPAAKRGHAPPAGGAGA